MDFSDEQTLSAFSRTLGCKVLRLDKAGVAHVGLSLEPHLRNRLGKMHGGAVFSLVDTAMGLACSASHGFDQQSVTIECKINYVRSISEGDALCIARVLHAGRRTLVVEAEVLQDDKLIAKAQGTFAVL
ncbi:PaaI family thioesterase [Pseudomonas sp. dw_358]|uniref:PaaI family thioesterase n=1 Tax=Pseudomonas sp. dw_358 TaxID=2720083 RepID=UPI001BD3F4DF|nr:PaaI family thioesterase [Pseudomonas sp. dw_358]